MTMMYSLSKHIYLWIILSSKDFIEFVYILSFSSVVSSGEETYYPCLLTKIESQLLDYLL